MREITLLKTLLCAKLQALTTAGQCLFKENKHDKSEKNPSLPLLKNFDHLNIIDAH